jgi:hypothetical protein
MVERYLSAERQDHDDFGAAFTKSIGEIVYDAKTIHGPWAMMTQASYDSNGMGTLGTGYGQKYMRDEHGHLNKVEG